MATWIKYAAEWRRHAGIEVEGGRGHWAEAALNSLELEVDIH